MGRRVPDEWDRPLQRPRDDKGRFLPVGDGWCREVPVALWPRFFGKRPRPSTGTVTWKGGK